MREAELLQSIIERSRSTLKPPPGAPLDRVRVGPGDDLAVLAEVSGSLLLGVDQVVDGLHVNAKTTPWNVIGSKAVRRSVSDIAAMAGMPIASVISLVLPQDATKVQFDALHDGLVESAQACDVPLVGGDIAVHLSPGPLTISVTVLARAPEGGAVLRSGGRVGDRVWVSGELGRTLDPDGGGAHLFFEPRVSVARALHGQLGEDLHAMIDLSDGLGRDGARLAKASGCTARLRAIDLPCARAASWQEALCDGEDYELLAAVSPEVDLPASVDGVQLTCIGVLEHPHQAGGCLLERPDGTVHCADEDGWDHRGDV
ncbi:MAG: thiamine-phosphate kinase [Phycisphaerales bacterium]|nr:thiamine-phosphate kinase [Phycisphaerales bacterium]